MEYQDIALLAQRATESAEQTVATDDNKELCIALHQQATLMHNRAAALTIDVIDRTEHQFKASHHEMMANALLQAYVSSVTPKVANRSSKIPGYAVVDKVSGMIVAYRTTMQKAYDVADRFPRESVIINMIKSTQAEIELMQRSEANRVLLDAAAEINDYLEVQLDIPKK